MMPRMDGIDTLRTIRRLPDEERARLREEGKGKALLLRQIERRFEGVN